LKHKLLLASLLVFSRLLAGSVLQAESARRFHLTGLLTQVDVAHSRVNVSIDDVPGYMDAMPMTYTVTRSPALKTLRPGQRIAATVVVVNKDNEYLENVVLDDRNKRPK
jgi:Cu/Ag efflux protein CusF